MILTLVKCLLNGHKMGTMVTGSEQSYDGGNLLMELTKEEQVFLRLLMRDAWYDCDMRNKSDSERKLFLKIQSKLSRELINA